MVDRRVAGGASFAAQAAALQREESRRDRHGGLAEKKGTRTHASFERTGLLHWGYRRRLLTSCGLDRPVTCDGGMTAMEARCLAARADFLGPQLSHAWVPEDESRRPRKEEEGVRREGHRAVMESVRAFGQARQRAAKPVPR